MDAPSSSPNRSPYRVRAMRVAIDEALQDTPVICILGPRQCGKSTFAQKHNEDRAYITLDDTQLLETILQDPQGYLRNLPDQVTIDEIQHALPLIRAIKMSVDQDRRPGKFILTGSANLLTLPRLSESLAGRMEIINLFPFTESEKDQSPGAFLQHVLDNNFPHEIVGQQDEIAPSELPQRLIAGGFPEAVIRTPARAAIWHRNYLTTLVQRDMQDVTTIRDTGEVTKLLRLLSNRTGTLLNASDLSRDLKIDRATADKYLFVLEALYLIRTLPPWHSNRSKRLIKTPKIHFIDSGLAASLSGLKASDWNRKRDKFGPLLESFVVQQIIAQAQWTDPDLTFSHYRDKDQVEVDLIIERGTDIWGIEVKTAATVTQSDGKGLRRLANIAGENFRGGFLLYNGSHTQLLPGSDNITAVPLRKFWTM